MKDEVIYCVYCGTKNKAKQEKCTSCGKDLNPKSDFQEYLKKRPGIMIKNGIFSMIINFIKSHLYGTILTCSIIFTVATGVAVNVQNSYFVEKVNERPVFESTYAGEGLNAEDLLNKYIQAIKENDTDTIKNLQFETFYPEIAEKINEEAKNVSDGFTPFAHHDLGVNGHIYFNDDDVKYGLYKLDDYYYGSPTFSGYNFIVYNFTTTYSGEDIKTYQHNEEENWWVSPEGIYGLVDEVQLIEMDGNLYVYGEDVSPEARNFSEIVPRGEILKLNNGDFSCIFISQEELDYLNANY